MGLSGVESAQGAAVAPPQARLAWRHYTLLALELGLATWVVSRFQIENRAFARLSLLVLIGFLVHARLPARWRPATFALLGMVGLGLVLGSINALWVLGLGGLLIGACHLPLPMRWRIGVLLALAAALVLLRAEVLASPWSSAIWPVLGSIFALRMIVFLYDRSHGVEAGSPWETLSYFFLLPNVCFPLFPVVDYKTYRRSYYSESAWECHQTGMAWITRGLLQLLLYRYIYYYVVLAPSEVDSWLELVQYVVSNLALYLRVSGGFHLVIGIVRLFGFALPETNFRYFLSSSVNDFWRRANIYWKDFMLKVFYYPAFFRLRRGGEGRAFVVSTLVVVGATWFLHSYQWFWLRGGFLLRWQDGVFWGFLGVAMIGNTLYERRHTRARGRHARAGWLPSPRRAVAVVLTFSFIAVLWSLWTCESFASWLAMWSAAATAGSDGTTHAGLGAPLALLALLVGGSRALRSGLGGLRPPSRRALATLAVLSGLLLLSAPAVYTRLGDRASAVVQSLRVAKLNRLDTERLQRGYYEDLLDVDRLNIELFSVLRSKPTGWKELHQTSALETRDDFILQGLAPNAQLQYKGQRLTTNRWGMRDRDYRLEKPPGTVRIALLGGSYVMGAGVADDQIFEGLVEEHLAERFPERRIELLNFAVGGYAALQRLRSLEIQALRFSPDVAIYVAHENDLFRLSRHLEAARRRGIEPPYPELRALLAKAGIDETVPQASYERRLAAYGPEILDFVYRRFVDTCRSHGVEPVWLFLPTLNAYIEPEDAARLEQSARRAGFETISLAGIWDGPGVDRFALRVADWDYHPNARGHRLIAERLYEELMSRPWLLSPGADGVDPTKRREGDEQR